MWSKFSALDKHYHKNIKWFQFTGENFSYQMQVFGQCKLKYMKGVICSQILIPAMINEQFCSAAFSCCQCCMNTLTIVLKFIKICLQTCYNFQPSIYRFLDGWSECIWLLYLCWCMRDKKKSLLCLYFSAAMFHDERNALVIQAKMWRWAETHMFW